MYYRDISFLFNKLIVKKRFLGLFFSFLMFSVILTTARSANAFSFAVLGDTQKFQGEKSGLGRSIRSLQKYHGVDFLVSMGDMCSGKKCEKKLRRWKKIVDRLNVPVYPVMGNHDLVSLDFWNSLFNPPANGPSDFLGICYSFDFENSHFVVLSSSYPAWHVIGASQRTWLEEDLSTTEKENVFVFFHAPAFPVDGKIKNSLDSYAGERDSFWQILDNHNVTATFSGHEHLFSRKIIDSSVFPGAQNRIYQIVEGNTDAYSHSNPVVGVDYYSRQKSYLVVDVDGTEIALNLYKTGGRLLDSSFFLNNPSIAPRHNKMDQPKNR